MCKIINVGLGKHMVTFGLHKILKGKYNWKFKYHFFLNLITKKTYDVRVKLTKEHLSKLDRWGGMRLYWWDSQI